MDNESEWSSVVVHQSVLLAAQLAFAVVAFSYA